MIPDQISISSAGSLSVAIVAFIFFVYQGWLAFERLEFRWSAWGSALSLSAALYAFAAFIQFNTPAGSANIFSELIQFSSVLLLIHAHYGFTFSYLNLPSKKYHRLAGGFHAILLILLWTTQLIIEKDFVARHFTGLHQPLFEPELGPLGPVFLLYCAGAGLWSLRYWIHNRHKKLETTIFFAGFLFWVILGVHDVLASVGVDSIQYLMEYGFLGFSVAIMTVTIRKFSNQFTIAEASKAELQQAHNTLEQNVAERTQALTAANRQMNREIAERRRAEAAKATSEARLRKIIDLIPHFVFAKDRNGQFIFANQAVAEAYGTTVEDLTGKSDADFNPNMKEVIHFQQHDQRVIDSGQPEEIPEERITDSTGSTHWLHTLKIPFSMTNGDINALLGVSTDITALKQAEQERIELEGRLNRAKKMEALGTLAGGVAHDLNNILSGITSYPELLLLETPTDSELYKPLSTIKTSGEKAAHIVGDLLTLARRGVSVTETVALNAIVESYLDSPEFEKLRKYHPQVNIDARLGRDLFNISGSPVHLSKAVMNLVSNATESIPEKGIVTIRTRNCYMDKAVIGFEEMSEGDYVMLAVSDTGVGISEADQEQIFEPFYTKKKLGRSGTGLGMAVVWGTVKDHSGYIDIKSKEGQGTTFTLYLPSNRESITEAVATPSSDELKGDGQTVLVIDDVEEQRTIAAAILGKLDYNVSCAASGEAAVAMIDDVAPDVIVLDMIMKPGIDGLETYRRIVARRPGQKAIIASGYSENDRVLAARELGAGEYVRKPYTMATIGLALKTALAHA